MKTSFLTLIFLVTALVSFSQTTLSSKVVDHQNQPIPFANVVLLKPDNSIYKGTTTDEDGNFIFKNVTSATYQLNVSFIGFKTYQKTINTSEKLLVIILQEDTNMLDEVELNVKKPTIKKKIDRLVFNIENTILSTGNAWDVLKKTPELLVNNDQLVIRNTSNIIILINDKRVYLSNTELKNLLESTSAQDITSVEIITNPPAKYEAEGSAVLNIKMRKNLVTGYKGSIGSSYKKARFGKGNIFTSHYFKNKTLNLYASYNHNRGRANRLEEEFIDFNDVGNSQKFHSNLDRNTWYKTHNFSANATLEISPKSSLTINGKFYYNPDRELKNDTKSEVLNNSEIIQSKFLTFNNTFEKSKNLGLNIDYELKINKKSSLQFSGHFTNYSKNGNQFVTTDFFNANKVKTNDKKFTTLSNQKTKIYNSQIDFSSHVTQNSYFEAGLKYANVASESDLSHYKIVNSQQQIDLNKTNSFNYKELNFSGYLSYKTSFDNFSIKGGLRAEYTQLEGYSITLNQSNKNNYFKLFPTAYLQYSFNDNHELGVSYGKRISRPSYTALNPFKFYYSDYSFYEGNPKLQPAITHNLSVQYTLNNQYNFDIYYSSQQDYITEINFQNNQTNELRYSFVNIPQKERFGISFNTNFNLNDRWNLTTQHSVYNNEDVFVATENNNQLVSNRIWGYYGYVATNYALLKNRSLTIELSGYLVTDGIQGSMRIEGSKDISLGLTKKIFNNNGSLSLQFSDIFKTQVVKVSTNYLNQQNYFIDDQETQFVRLGFRYNFGNKSLKKKIKKKSINEVKRL